MRKNCTLIILSAKQISMEKCFSLYAQNYGYDWENKEYLADNSTAPPHMIC